MSTSTNPQGAEVTLPPPAVFAGALLLGLLMRRSWPIAPFGPRILQGGFGFLCLVGGIALFAWALQAINRSGQDPKPWTPTPVLIQDGPYALSRNPLYLGFVLILNGIGLLLGDLWPAFMGLAAAAIVQHTAIVPEEAYLETRFGKTYRDYCHRVRRWI